MTQDEIIRMALEADCYKTETGALITDNVDLERFAALVAAHEREKCFDAAMKAAEKAVDTAMLLEREACAKVCDEWNWSSKHGTNPSSQLAAVAAAIRART